MNSEIPHQTEYEFSLVLDGLDGITNKLENRLFEAGCDDATLSFQHGRGYLQFARSADTLEAAIRSAMRDVHVAGVGIAACMGEIK